MSAAKSFHLRLESAALDSIKRLASDKKVSINRLILDAIDLYLKLENERVWREGFEAMGRDTEACDVEYMIPAAREIVLFV